jgi:hypothetical protein
MLSPVEFQRMISGLGRARHPCRLHILGAVSLRGAAFVLVLATLVGGCDFALPRWGRPRGPLTDDADVLDTAAEGRIVAWLERARHDRGIDYRVAIESVDRGSLEERSHRLYEERSVGEETGGRGLVVLIDPVVKQVRVEAGNEGGSNFTDLAASERLANVLTPYFAFGNLAAGIEAALPTLLDVPLAGGDADAAAPSVATGSEAPPRAPDAILWDPAEVEPAPGEAQPEVEARAVDRAVGAESPSSFDRLREIPDGVLDDATKVALQSIMVPQSDPRKSRDLEIALMRKGIYYRDTPLYDGAWRNAHLPKGWDAEYIRAMARELDRPYEVEIEGSRAIIYYQDAAELAPTFLRRKSIGWMIDGSQTAKAITYDEASSTWYAIDRNSPYFRLLTSVLPMRPISLPDGTQAWQVDRRK